MYLSYLFGSLKTILLSSTLFLELLNILFVIPFFRIVLDILNRRINSYGFSSQEIKLNCIGPNPPFSIISNYSSFAFENGTTSPDLFLLTKATHRLPGFLQCIIALTISFNCHAALE